MGDINLLPEEFRQKEKKESEAARKKPKKVRVEMSTPSVEEKKRPLTQPKPSLLSRLFRRKVKKPAKPIFAPPVTEKPPELKISQSEKKTFDFSRPAEEPTKEPTKVESIEPVKKFSFGKKEKAEEVSPPLPKPIISPSEKKEPVLTKEPLVKIKTKTPRPKKKFNFFNWLKSKFSFGIKKEKVKEKAPLPIEPKKKVAQEPEADFDINLMPEEITKQQELELSKKILTSSLIVFCFVLLVGVIYLGIIWYQISINNQIQQLDLEIQDLAQQIANYEKTKSEALNLQQRIKLIRELLNKHVYWTEFFALLEENTIEEVYYNSFSMAGTQKLVLSAVGKDYESVAKQLTAFQEATDFVAQVEVDSASAKIDERGNYLKVNFNIDLTIRPGVWLKPIK